MQITGSVSEYIGDKQLSAISVTVLEGSKSVIITDTTTKEANDYETNFGKLVRVRGQVTGVTLAGGLVESIAVQDDSGEACRVFIDGYIGYSDSTSQALEEFVKEGAQISAVGFVSHDAEGNRLRVRDRSEILAVSDAEEPVPESYKVTVSVENGSFEGPETAADGSDYTGTVRAADGYRLPDSIAVKVDGQELARDVYAWDASSGTLTIPGKLVTGDLEITAVCVAESGDDSQGGQQTPDDDAQGDQNNQQKPGSGQNNQTQNGGSQNGQQSQGGGSSVQTGDPAAAGAWAAVLILAAAGVTVLVTGRKRIRK